MVSQEGGPKLELVSLSAEAVERRKGLIREIMDLNERSVVVADRIADIQASGTAPDSLKVIATSVRGLCREWAILSRKAAGVSDVEWDSEVHGWIDDEAES